MLLSFSASTRVLRAALFPVQELLERCRLVFSALSLAKQPTRATVGCVDADASGQLSNGVEPTATVNARGNTIDGDVKDVKVAHWATAGITAVSDALEKALASEDAFYPSSSSSPSPYGDVSGGSNPGVKCADRCTAAARSENLPSPSCKSRGQSVLSVSATGNCCQPRGNDEADLADMSVAVDTGRNSQGLKDVDESGNTNDNPGDDGRHASAESSEKAIARDGASGTVESMMMDLDSFECLLNAGDPAADSCQAPRARETGMIGTEGQDDSNGNRSGILRPQEEQRGDRNAWELVETWTPCAIGTLPGSSNVSLRGHF